MYLKFLKALPGLHLLFRLSVLHMISLLVSSTSYRCSNIKYRFCKGEKLSNPIVCLKDLAEFFCDSDLLRKTWFIWFIFDLDLFSIIDTLMEF